MGLIALRWPDGLAWPLVLPAVLVLVVLLLAWWGLRVRRARRPARPGRADPVLVAHVARLRALPRHRVLVRRRRALGALLALGALVTVAGAAVVVARPQVEQTERGEERSRDVMLCLDASASMDDDNVEVVRAVRDVVDDLEGDRVGLTLWSGAAVTVFPLTEDRAYVLDQLAVAERAFARGDESYFAGVQLPDPRASLIGDGLVSCAQRFDRPEEERARAVVLSSDNDPLGESVYDLDQAAAYAARRDVLVYAVGAPDLAGPGRTTAREELARAAEATGGLLALVGSDGGTDAVVERIDALERARVDLPPRTVRADAPGWAAVVAGAGALLVVLAWVVGAALALAARRGRATGGGAR
ncbi:VWA domain-containing protein [Nocardioides sp. AX2bis]|uniref:VWA domain-containing protein n=1 Tax=Nocardioides sp. AX2bis TaxID=2653157 RepID=UPI0012F36CF9|nr:VWA domain-containing protein [Nocardioides sp. AX2bis]VXA93931.1 conserved membrane hypothetical protein [Nocardioides sp. AX2bis]